MKSILSVLVLVASCSAFSASTEVLKAVLDSKEISNVQDIQKMEVVETYKCPNCYGITLTGTNLFGEAYVKVQTEQSFEYDAQGKIVPGKINVKYVEGSK